VLPVQGIFEDLTSFEGRDGAGLYLDRGAGPWVSAGSGRSVLGLKRSEAGHLNLVALPERCGDDTIGVEQDLDRSRCFSLLEIGAFRNCLNEFSFVHRSPEVWVWEAVSADMPEADGVPIGRTRNMKRWRPTASALP
jgi:hypothetical protein